MAVWLGFCVMVGLGAYLLGSLPTGYLAGRIVKGIDIREHGSKSTGATNVLRTVGKIPAIVVLLIDVLKGAAAIALTRLAYELPMIASIIPAEVNLQSWLPYAVTLSGLAVLLGHSRSIWLNFSGGKSVATGLGLLLAMALPVGLGSLAAFAVTLAISRIVSLSSIAAALAAIGLMVGLQQPLPFQGLAIAGGLFVIWRHQANLQRLIAGTEPRLGQKVQGSEP
ncbi:MAG: glycerol-3-phosphate 1-O-acyltransferase PlsY [Timaviella obliquedivisa GSE-PSE-MK23-08B]|nr:glycerol-3-phosphate 1-O-acyltransferase PlsY [Timaviella obliquedivisa GSE-PSE-MK23-08B]